ncbi:LutC/YkgG family protein [Aquisalimonas sp. APHAB1-3]|uniref:LutC/YkgG family protein n=1 Tax=Aquisalimonas sp. APHAB1-3 TaxID=3402080 RepID=UPI003AAFAC2C
MSSARDRILGKIRSNLGRTTAPDAAAASSSRLAALGDETSPRPVWDDDDLSRFLRCFEAAAATWARVDTVADTGDAVATYLADKPAGNTVHLAPHPLLDDVSWPNTLTTARATHGREALVGVSVAELGVAETGSLVLFSGADTPTTLNFLPDYHIVLLRTDAVVPHFEDVWARMRERGGFPPRSFNFITGPSRTADVEQTLQLGAHGPRSLHLILVAARD